MPPSIAYSKTLGLLDFSPHPINIEFSTSLFSARQASVAYLFSRNGSITFQPKDGVDLDDALDAAIDVGAQDVDLVQDGGIQVLKSRTQARESISYSSSSMLRRY